MAMNPMQRKANNYLLIGVLVTLLITGSIIVFLFMQLNNLKEEQAKEIEAKVNIYTLNQDVKSGQILTEDMYSINKIDKTIVPSDATSSLEVINEWFLETKEGKRIYTDSEGLYIDEKDSIIEVYQNEENGYYRIVDGEPENIASKNSIQTDDEGYFTVDSKNEDTITRVYKIDDKYYTYKLNDSNNKREIVYLEIANVPLVAKVDMNKNTVITPNLVAKSDSIITDTVRKQEYNMIVLPSQIQNGDTVDIRIRLSNGVDFIVASKKSIEIPTIEGIETGSSIIMNMSEEETLVMSNAIIEAYIDQGSYLYATTYVEPGLQTTAIPTYVPSGAVQNAINSNPNILQEAKIQLIARYNQNVGIRTDIIEGALSQYVQDKVDNIEEGVQEEITRAKEAREAYLESLGGY